VFAASHLKQQQHDVGTAGRGTAADHCDFKRFSVTRHSNSNGSANSKRI